MCTLTTMYEPEKFLVVDQEMWGTAVIRNPTMQPVQVYRAPYKNVSQNSQPFSCSIAGILNVILW